MKRIEKINEYIHRLTIPYKDIYTTVLFIKTEEGVVLFDTATFEEDVKEQILPTAPGRTAKSLCSRHGSPQSLSQLCDYLNELF